jgi:phosphoribosylamine--glycine ligase
MDILILGSGGREHALTRALAASAAAGYIYVAPGNGGTAQIAENVDLDVSDAQAVSDFAATHAIDLVVIGPEQPLVDGVADVLRARGVAVFGPGADGARIEGSKRFAKEFMDRHHLPTAAWGSFERIPDALAFIAKLDEPLVVKADGLAAGKGVIVAATREEAGNAVVETLGGRFGSAGKTVVIEECLRGPECSLLVLTDGKRMLEMAPAQDHKRAYEGDLGPNTGGMGVYSPVPIVTESEQAQMSDIMARAVAGLAAEDIDYRGVLYGGFMLTADGPKLLEFNARFGDPETQVLLPRLKSDFLTVLMACARGDLGTLQLEWSPDSAVSVVLASEGYPGSYAKGKLITGIDAAEADADTIVYQAGTHLDEDGRLLSAGGRVLNVTALAPSFAEARARAYAAVEKIDFEGKFYRRDIGARAEKGRAAWD